MQFAQWRPKRGQAIEPPAPSRERRIFHLHHNHHQPPPLHLSPRYPRFCPPAAAAAAASLSSPLAAPPFLPRLPGIRSFHRALLCFTYRSSEDIAKAARPVRTAILSSLCAPLTSTLGLDIPPTRKASAESHYSVSSRLPHARASPQRHHLHLTSVYIPRQLLLPLVPSAATTSLACATPSVAAPSLSRPVTVYHQGTTCNPPRIDPSISSNVPTCNTPQPVAVGSIRAAALKHPQRPNHPSDKHRELWRC
jgi:hypothetical protein